MLNEVFVIIVTHLKGEDEGVCVVHISGKGIEYKAWLQGNTTR